MTRPRLCYDLARVRILLDYRPALRQRTGVGEYVARAGRAPSRPARGPGRHADAVFELVGGPPAPRRGPRRGADRRAAIPVRILNLPGIAWGGRRSSGSPGRWTSTHSHAPPADAGRHGGAGRHHPRSVLPRPIRATRPRNPPRLRGAGRRPRPARPIAVVVVSDYTRRMVQRAARRAAGPDRRLFAGCAATGPHGDEPAARGPILLRRHARAAEERRRTAGGLRRAAAPGAPTRRRWCSPDGARRRACRTSPAGIPLPVTSGRLGYVSDEARRTLYAQASVLVLPSLDEGFGLPALEAMTVGRAGRRRRTAGRCRRWSARRACWSNPDDPEATGGGAPAGPGRREPAASDGRRRDPPRAAATTGRAARYGLSRLYAAALAERRGHVVRRPLRIGVDARELLGETTGVGRYLGELIRRWTARADAGSRQFLLYAPAPLALRLPAGRRRAAHRGTRGRHLVGTDGAAARGGGRRSRRLLRAGLHGSAGPADAAGGHDPRHLVRRPPGVVPPARGAAAALAHPARRRARRGHPDRLAVLQAGDRGAAPDRPGPDPGGPAGRGAAGGRRRGARRARRSCSSSARSSTAAGSPTSSRPSPVRPAISRRPGSSSSATTARGRTRTCPRSPGRTGSKAAPNSAATSPMPRWRRSMRAHRSSRSCRNTRASASRRSRRLRPACLRSSSTRRSRGKSTRDAACYVAPGDIAGTALALRRFLTSPDEARSLLARAPAVLARYSWETAARETLDHLERVAAAMTALSIVIVNFNARRAPRELPPVADRRAAEPAARHHRRGQRVERRQRRGGARAAGRPSA